MVQITTGPLLGNFRKFISSIHLRIVFRLIISLPAHSALFVEISKVEMEETLANMPISYFRTNYFIK